MNRRAFIKLIGVIAGSLALPVVPGGAVSLAGGPGATVGATLSELEQWMVDGMEADMLASARKIEWVTWTMDTTIPEAA